MCVRGVKGNRKRSGCRLNCSVSYRTSMPKRTISCDIRASAAEMFSFVMRFTRRCVVRVCVRTCGTQISRTHTHTPPAMVFEFECAFLCALAYAMHRHTPAHERTCVRARVSHFQWGEKCGRSGMVLGFGADFIEYIPGFLLFWADGKSADWKGVQTENKHRVHVCAAWCGVS